MTNMKEATHLHRYKSFGIYFIIFFLLCFDQVKYKRIDSQNRRNLKILSKMYSRSLKEIQQYDLFRSPPDISIAAKHRLANQVSEQIAGCPDEICPCCFKCTARRQYDLRCSISDIKFLGEGVGLYFGAIKMIIILMAVLLVFFMSEWFAYHHFFCRQDCGLTQITILSSRLSFQRGIDLQLSFVGMIVLLIMTFLAKKYYDIQVYRIKKDHPEPQHYALLFEGFPKCKEEDVKMWIYKQCGLMPIAVHMLFDVKTIKEVISLKEKDVIARNRDDIKFLANTLTMSQSFQKELIEKKENNVKMEIRRLDSLLNKYQQGKAYEQAGAIIVVFEKAKDAQDICSMYSLSLVQKVRRLIEQEGKQLKYGQNVITVEKAMNPRDCIWQNFHPNQPHIFSKVIFSILLLLLCYVLLFLAYSLHIYLFKMLIWPISFLTTFLCYSLFHVFLHILVEISHSVFTVKSYTSKEIISYYGYGYFNIFFICIIAYSTDLQGAQLLQFFNLILILDAFIHPVIKIFNFANIYNKILSGYIASLEKSKNPYPQNYFNRLMEGRQFKIGENHHYILRAIFSCCYFSHAVPYCFAYYIVSLFIEYLIQKYILLRKCKIPPKISSALSNKFMQSLGFLPVIYVIGSYNYCLHFYPDESQGQWIFLVLVISAKILTLLLVAYFNTKTAEWLPQKSYLDIQNELDEYYQLQNEIIKYNGQLKDLHRNFSNRMMLTLRVPPCLDQTLDPILEMQYKNSQIYSPEIKNSRARLVKRLLSTSIEMNQFTGLKEFQASLE